MKLKHKILPLIGLSTAVLSIAPITLVSCRNIGDGYIDMLDHYWEHAIQHEFDSFSIDQANEEFIKQCSKNLDILRSELYSSFSAYSYMWVEGVDYASSRQMKIIESKMEVSNVAITSQDFVDAAGTHKIPTISYTLKGNVIWSTPSKRKLSGDIDTGFNAPIIKNEGTTYCFTNYDIEIQNVPVSIDREACGKVEDLPPSFYGFLPKIEWMLGLEGTQPPMSWSIKYNLDVETKYSSYLTRWDDLEDFESYTRNHILTSENLSTWTSLDRSIFDCLVGLGTHIGPRLIMDYYLMCSYNAIPVVGFMSLYFARTYVDVQR